MQGFIQTILPEIKATRQQIHRQPELCYQEKMTSQLVAEKLKAFGLQNIKTNIGKTGVTALIDSGKPGKTVALRADMDGLPVTELTNLPYQSQRPGQMHACGHDGHTATLLGVAKILTTFKPVFSGKIKLIFQPAEEGGAGAKAMIDDGVLDNPKVDAIFGYHNYPGFAEGVITTRSGCLMAGNCEFQLTVHGKGGHAGLPHLAIDPIYIGSLIVQALQSLSSRLTDPVEPIVLSINQFHAGSATNIIPDTAEISGSLRISSLDMREKAKQQIQHIASSIAAAHNATAIVNIPDGYPPVVNTKAETDLVLQTANTLFGQEKAVLLANMVMPAEDFSYFLQKIPGCYFFIGAGVNKPSLHSAYYDYNDEILATALQMMTQVALNYLQGNS